jgi:hypothetical protein
MSKIILVGNSTAQCFWIFFQLSVLQSHPDIVRAA